MSDASKIEWTNSTWNPVTGCTKVSPGCDHCYAERITERFRGPGSFAEVKLHPDRLHAPLRWRKPRRVFVNSMSDLFHADVPDEFIARVFAVMALAPRHTFQVLTKRHARMKALLNSSTFQDAVVDTVADHPLLDHARARGASPLCEWDASWPIPNVWGVVSVEDQHWADIRIPVLLDTPAAVRGVSCEPLLGSVDLRAWPYIDPKEDGYHPIDWVIVGGESGPGARPMDLQWARGLISQCRSAHIPVFVKQLGTVWSHENGYGRTNAVDWDLWPADLRIREYPRVVRSGPA